MGLDDLLEGEGFVIGKHVLFPADQLAVGEKTIVTLEGKSIGVFNVKGSYYAIKNTCPHQNAQLCTGEVMGMMLPSDPHEYVYGKDGEIIRCPWHGWEFDITSGKSVFDPKKCLVKSYEVQVLDDLTEDVVMLETYPVTVESGWVVIKV
jgi:nitrite reductase/ring-hydroxylating ferredoxin subunit